MKRLCAIAVFAASPALAHHEVATVAVTLPLAATTGPILLAIAFALVRRLRLWPRQKRR